MLIPLVLLTWMACVAMKPVEQDSSREHHAIVEDPISPLHP